jgi:SAM-dependent methyltransferase
MSESLAARYTGAVAAGYDDKRSGSARWRNEVAAFDGFLSAIKPARILDCPFGTGRWIENYDAIEASVVGVDISDDMLRGARGKLQRPDAYRLVTGSVFDFDFSTIRADLIVCVRFLNWVSLPDAMRAVQQLSRADAPHMLVGCSVIPDHVSSLRRWTMRAALAGKNALSKGGTQYVHEEQSFMRGMTRCCWKLSGTRFVFSNPSRYNYFYLFARNLH